ncbi:hypothetical protein TNCV_2365961 [Trichonephila clavipes]|nr:hypothetical protein TNCV_2365961 [Trichonephila clavipes]
MPAMVDTLTTGYRSPARAWCRVFGVLKSTGSNSSLLREPKSGIVFSEDFNSNQADFVIKRFRPVQSLQQLLWWNGPTFLTTKDFPERNILSSVTDSDEFKGANAELKRLYKLVINPDPELAGFLVEDNINWKFLPPRAPNYGGL